MNRLLATTALGLLLSLGTAVAQDPAPPADPQASPPAAQPAQPSMPDSSMPEQAPAAPSAEPAIPAPDQSSEAPQSISPKASDEKSAVDESAAPSDEKSAVDESAAPSATASAQFLNEQKSDDYLASNLIGLTVSNAENEQLGEINDLVTDKDGKVLAVLVGIGGFLGIGEKDIAVRFEDLKLSRDENNNVTAMLNANQETLASAPDFQTLNEKEVSVGSDSGSQPAPSSQ